MRENWREWVDQGFALVFVRRGSAPLTLPPGKESVGVIKREA